jgi:hypothetical protein
MGLQEWEHSAEYATYITPENAFLCLMNPLKSKETAVKLWLMDESILNESISQGRKMTW